MNALAEKSRIAEPATVVARDEDGDQNSNLESATARVSPQPNIETVSPRVIETTVDDGSDTSAIRQEYYQEWKNDITEWLLHKYHLQDQKNRLFALLGRAHIGVPFHLTEHVQDHFVPRWSPFEVRMGFPDTKLTPNTALEEADNLVNFSAQENMNSSLAQTIFLGALKEAARSLPRQNVIQAARQMLLGFTQDQDTSTDLFRERKVQGQATRVIRRFMEPTTQIAQAENISYQRLQGVLGEMFCRLQLVTELQPEQDEVRGGEKAKDAQVVTLQKEAYELLLQLLLQI